MSELGNKIINLRALDVQTLGHYWSDICNEGWLTYITKELDEKELKNLYFP